MQPHGGPFVKEAIPGVKHIVAVASGKGGVGKSTVSTNLAVALSQQGLSVGLMDADIYGPSLPTMMNVQGRPLADASKRIIPLEAYGIKVMSMGFLMPETEAVIWRGPMVMGAVRHNNILTQTWDAEANADADVATDSGRMPQRTRQHFAPCTACRIPMRPAGNSLFKVTASS